MDKLTLATASTSRSVRWSNVQLTWEELTERLREPVRTSETVAAYHQMSKDEQGKCKDVGGFVGGPTVDGRRRKGSVRERHLLTIDMDHMEQSELESVWVDVDALGCDYVIYSTHSHTPESPRVRVVIPLSRAVDVCEYEAIGRQVAFRLGQHMVDHTTYQAERLMYWPSCPSDGEYYFKEESLVGPLNADSWLRVYADYRDQSQWPRHEIEKANPTRLTTGAKQQDPTEKEGLIGAFCRTYTIQEAMDKFLPGVYEEAGKGRYTYVKGSSFGGAVVYEDRWLYSNHQTDPAGLRLCNAWDLVRIHLFGHLDEGKETERKSTAAMEEMVGKDRGTVETRTSEMFGEVEKAETEAQEKESREWLSKYIGKKGIEVVPGLFYDILVHDPKLRGRFCYDTFLERKVIRGDVPWDRNPYQGKFVSDSDMAALRIYIAQHYGNAKGKDMVQDALDMVSMEHRVNAIQELFDAIPEWDGVPRAESLIIDFLGAEDTPLTRAMTLRHLLAGYTRIQRPGHKYDQMVVLVGPQGIGKSTLIRALAMDPAYFIDGMSSPDQGKEAMQELLGKFIVEMAEMASLRNADVNAIKNFLSKTFDDFRPAYAREAIHRGRQCIFWATTNESVFLRDETGERRYWPVEVGVKKPKLDVFDTEELAKYIHMVWAEIRQIYKEGKVKLTFPRELSEALDSLQSKHKNEDPWDGIIDAFLSRPLPISWNDMSPVERKDYFKFDRFARAREEGEELVLKREFVCIAEIANECATLGLSGNDLNRKDSVRISGCLRRIGWDGDGGRKYVPGYGRQRVFYDPLA